MYAAYPIEEIRKQFPSLQRAYHDKTVAYFDGPGGAQTLQSAIDAISNYLTRGGANLHGNFPTSFETEELIATAKQDIKSLFNAEKAEVAFGPNATSLMFAVSRALARSWKEGDEIILTELEHHSNIDSWRTAAEDKGVIVKYIPFNPSTLTLDLGMLPELLTSKTKLVAVGSASNCIGTITDVKRIAEQAKKVGALVAVDAVHAIPHMYVDMEEQNIDMLFSSAYKFFAAHVGMAIIRRDLFESLDVYKVVPAPGNVPDRLEMGTQNHEGIPTVSSAVQFIASLGSGETLQEQIKSGYQAIEAYENNLAEKMRSELAKIDKVKLYQADASVPKTPTVAFRVEGISPKEFCIRMCEEHSIFIAEGDFYAKILAERLGIRNSGSFIRAGLAPYNTEEEVMRFIKGTKAIIQTIKG
ncbi:cysteine desulfurase-like protein [Oceanobacillus sojae]|uniref:cysteine desulfurase-like protein n=1 Tax=Oceanobacillus sojae TaxID=582851 RepID=UPI0009887F4F|nr:cysteine desulfurase-like protein [Oceanobacillus sojae]MCT1903735.1 cysteine desulfurase-like protein [Oceanobacillus sojae]